MYHTNGFYPLYTYINIIVYLFICIYYYYLFYLSIFFSFPTFAKCTIYLYPYAQINETGSRLLAELY